MEEDPQVSAVLDRIQARVLGGGRPLATPLSSHPGAQAHTIHSDDDLLAGRPEPTPSQVDSASEASMDSHGWRSGDALDLTPPGFPREGESVDDGGLTPQAGGDSEVEGDAAAAVEDLPGVGGAPALPAGSQEAVAAVAAMPAAVSHYPSPLSLPPAGFSADASPFIPRVSQMNHRGVVEGGGVAASSGAPSPPALAQAPSLYLAPAAAGQPQPPVDRSGSPSSPGGSIPALPPAQKSAIVSSAGHEGRPAKNSHLGTQSRGDRRRLSRKSTMLSVVTQGSKGAVFGPGPGSASSASSAGSHSGGSRG